MNRNSPTKSVPYLSFLGLSALTKKRLNVGMDIYAIRKVNLRRLIDTRANGVLARFAEAIETDPNYLSQILSEKTKARLGSALARKIEERLQLVSGYMDVIQGDANVEDAPDIKGKVPLISWVQAGHWAEVEDPYAFGDAEDWLPSVKKFGPRAYALRIRGESMFNPGAKHSFSDGEIIFVDPDYPANHGSFVVVRIDDENEATFKQLIREGATSVYLRAINPAWPNPIIKVDGDATICGVCRGKYVEF